MDNATTEEAAPRLRTCITCGFFGKHALLSARLIPTPTFYEIERPDREAGRAFTHVPDTLVGEVPTQPICYRQVIDYPAEVQRRIEAGRDREHAVLSLLTEGRICQEWFEYVWGLNPMQHLGGKAAQDAERRQREWERLLSQDTKRFQTELAAKSDDTQKAMLKISGGQLKASIASIAVGVVIVVVATALTIRCTDNSLSIDGAIPVIIVEQTATLPPTAAAESTPTPSPESTPDTASSPTDAEP